MTTEQTLTQRNREALRLLHEAAQALSDGELDYCRRLHTQAQRTLSPRWWPRLGALVAYRDSLQVEGPGQ